MKREERTPDRRLGDALREGDPAAFDSTMTDEERRRINAQLMHVGPEDPAERARGWLNPVLAVGVGLLVLAVVSNWPTRDRHPTAPVQRTAAVENVAERTTTEGHEVQQVRFVTSGGTQIIWLLEPDLDR
jgi:hypothetical protein